MDVKDPKRLSDMRRRVGFLLSGLATWANNREFMAAPDGGYMDEETAAVAAAYRRETQALSAYIGGRLTLWGSAPDYQIARLLELPAPSLRGGGSVFGGSLGDMGRKLAAMEGEVAALRLLTEDGGERLKTWGIYSPASFAALQAVKLVRIGELEVLRLQYREAGEP